MIHNTSTSDDALAELLTLKVVVNEWGSIHYRNQQGQLHRTHGPAFISAFGSEYWYQYGERHRTDGPAVEYADGSNGGWFLNGQHLTKAQFNERVKSLR